MTNSKKKACQCRKFIEKVICNECGGYVDYRRPDTLLPDEETFAKELYEVCCYPQPEKWEEELEKSVWRIRSGILLDFLSQFGPAQRT